MIARKRSTQRTPVRKKRKGPDRRVSVVRDRKYMDWLKDEPCVVCYFLGPQTSNTEPAHTAKTNGMASKGPDSSCIPLCRTCHDEMDGRLNTKIVTKEQFAAKYGLDLAAIAAEFYARFKAEC